jgi:hypothetical protein
VTLTDHTSSSLEVSGNGSSAAAAMVSINDIAAQKDNPSLWLAKYNFYINKLKLTAQEAMRWADSAVRVNTEARREFNIQR